MVREGKCSPIRGYLSLAILFISIIASVSVVAIAGKETLFQTPIGHLVAGTSLLILFLFFAVFYLIEATDEKENSGGYIFALGMSGISSAIVIGIAIYLSIQYPLFIIVFILTLASFSIFMLLDC